MSDIKTLCWNSVSDVILIKHNFRDFKSFYFCLNSLKKFLLSCNFLHFKKWRLILTVCFWWTVGPCCFFIRPLVSAKWVIKHTYFKFSIDYFMNYLEIKVPSFFFEYFYCLFYSYCFFSIHTSLALKKYLKIIQESSSNAPKSKNFTPLVWKPKNALSSVTMCIINLAIKTKYVYWLLTSRNYNASDSLDSHILVTDTNTHQSFTLSSYKYEEIQKDIWIDCKTDQYCFEFRILLLPRGNSMPYNYIVQISIIIK